MKQVSCPLAGGRGRGTARARWTAGRLEALWGPLGASHEDGELLGRDSLVETFVPVVEVWT